MQAVKSIPSGQTPNKQGELTLQITGALQHAAKEVVHAYCAFNWEELRAAELDVVHLNFEDDAGLERAEDLIHQIASANPAS
jgi:hypothetical protein